MVWVGTSAPPVSIPTGFSSIPATPCAHINLMSNPAQGLTYKHMRGSKSYHASPNSKSKTQTTPRTTDLTMWVLIRKIPQQRPSRDQRTFAPPRRPSSSAFSFAMASWNVCSCFSVAALDSAACAARSSCADEKHTQTHAAQKNWGKKQAAPTTTPTRFLGPFHWLEFNSF